MNVYRYMHAYIHLFCKVLIIAYLIGNYFHKYLKYLECYAYLFFWDKKSDLTNNNYKSNSMLAK